MSCSQSLSLSHSFSFPFSLSRILSLICAFTATINLSLSAWAASPDDGDLLLQNLKSDHPRLLLSKTTAKDIKASLANYDDDNDDKRQSFAILDQKAQSWLTLPVVQYKNGDMLEISRTALKRIITLSFLYRACGNSAYLQRAKAEMLAAASFPDWHPDHFLDTAEMMEALAIGYDWLYDGLTVGERQTIRSAIASKGLAAAKSAYDKQSYFWVKENNTNWNTVCNGSILIAALALAHDPVVSNNDAEEALACEMVGRSFAHFRAGLVHYAPDGALDEGPTYWHYATAYAVRTIAAMQSACGSDYDLTKSAGLDRTGDFIMAMIGQSGLLFNYSDSGPKLEAAPELFWLAKTYNKPVLAYKARDLLISDRTNSSVFDMLWWTRLGRADDLRALPCAQMFGGTAPVLAMRSSWTDPLGAYVGLLAGANDAHHSHLGLGDFVYDFDGVRWVCLLGPDNYDMPGFFDVSKGNDSPRWQYFRNKTISQNVVNFAGRDQDYLGRGLVVESQLKKAETFNYAILNLLSGYRSAGISSMRRGICLFKDQGVLLVQDEFGARHSDEAVWQINTPAHIEIVGPHQALLSNGRRRMIVDLLAPSRGHFETELVTITPPQNKISGITRLTVKMGDLGKGNLETISVLFSPYYQPKKSKKSPVKVIPLSEWKSALSSPAKR